MNIQNRIHNNTRVRVLFFILSTTVVVGISIFILSATLSLIYKYRLGYEGYVMYMASDWSTMFTPIGEPPYVVTIYPPIYMIVVGILDSIINDIIYSARIISILSGLGTAIFVWKIIDICSEEKNDWVPIVFSLLFLANPVVIDWSVKSRPDILALLFVSIALYVYISKEGFVQLVGVGGFVLLTLFTKHTFIGLPIALTLAYFFDYNWKLAFGWAISVVSSGLFILLLLNIATQGAAWEHLVLVNSALGYSFINTVISSMMTFRRYVVLLALALLAIMVKYDKIHDVFLIYGVISFVPLLFLGKVGSAMNFQLEQILALTILGGILLSNLLPRLSDLMSGGDEYKFSWLQLLMIILIIGQFGLYIGLPTSATQGSAEVEYTVQNFEGPILSEDMVLSIKNDNVIMYQSFIYAQLVDRKYLNETPITSKISDSEYTMIILLTDVDKSTSGRWTSSQLDAIRSNYKLTEKHGKYYIYEPIVG